MKSIPERDWKVLRSLKDEKLAKFCDGVFAKIGAVIANKGTESHKAYLNLWSVLRKEDEIMGTMFDELKRSNAVHKLAAWRHYGMLSDEELALFTDETRDSVVYSSEL